MGQKVMEEVVLMLLMLFRLNSGHCQGRQWPPKSLCSFLLCSTVRVVILYFSIILFYLLNLSLIYLFLIHPHF